MDKRPCNVVSTVSPLVADSLRFGTMESEIEIQEYPSLRNLYGNASYIITCKQRINIPGKGLDLNDKQVASYDNYPIALIHSMVPKFPSHAICRLIDYTPKTVNTAVVSAGNSSKSDNSTVSQQHTTGSSTSQTNTYDVSASVGFQGFMMTGDISAGYSNSTINEHSQSNTAGTSSSQDQQTGLSTSMTLKDWGSYAKLDLTRLNPTWSWLQEYPWDISQFHAHDDNDYVNLPQYVQDRLYDQAQHILYPPSQLAMYGVDFVSMARWIVAVPPQDVGAVAEAFSVAHSFQCYFASHDIVDDKLVASLTVPPAKTTVEVSTIPSFTQSDQPISLPLVSLETINEAGANNGAIVGFVPDSFIYSPDDSGQFRIRSAQNNLYITGKGFTKEGGAPYDLDQVLTAAGVAADKPATLTVQFKLANKALNLALLMRNWKLDDASCLLTLRVNGNNAMTRTVDSAELSDGDTNVTSISLCNRDLSSDAYYDYLKIGLNTIDLTISPADANKPCGYALRALAIA